MPDHVLAEMLQRMGLVVDPVHAAFEPEGGAYEASTATHGHVHDAHCGHDHASHDHTSHDHGGDPA